MSNLENKVSVLKIDYSDKTKLKEYITAKYKSVFNWKYYTKYYDEVGLKTLDEAWENWVSVGIGNQRKFFLNSKKTTKSTNKHTPTKTTFSNKVSTIPSNRERYQSKGITYNPMNEEIVSANLLQHNVFVYKDKYDNYGVQYFGWKKTINAFIEYFVTNYNETIVKNEQQYFIDDWIEKLLGWGNKTESKHIIKELISNNWKLITFLHTPPCSTMRDNDIRHEEMIYSSQYGNKQVFELINNNNLKDKIQFIYTLSAHHKEYLLNKTPHYKYNLLSINHPIEITGQEKTFDYELFLQNRQILHIGWQMINFKQFVDFKIPSEFFKSILVKSSFENDWNKLYDSLSFDKIHSEYITVLKELKNCEYEKLFVNSCLFVYFEDCSINNIILECIKFNTPIIINKIPAVVQYLGEDYPLYYSNPEDLNNLKHRAYLLSKIVETNKYLENMNKTHVSVEAFNSKLAYDLYKLNTNNNNLSTFILIDNLECIENNIVNLYNIFSRQVNNEKNILTVVIKDNLITDNPTAYTYLINKLDTFKEIAYNISYETISGDDNYATFVDWCFQSCKTEYLTFIDFSINLMPNYSTTVIDYLNTNYACDITYCSYSIKHQLFQTKFIFDKDIYGVLEHTSYFNFGVVFRKGIRDICKFNTKATFSNTNVLFIEFLIRTKTHNLNICCCSNLMLLMHTVF